MHPLMLSVDSKSHFRYATMQTQHPIHLNARHTQGFWAARALRAEGTESVTEDAKENTPVERTERYAFEHAIRA